MNNDAAMSRAEARFLEPPDDPPVEDCPKCEGSGMCQACRFDDMNTAAQCEECGGSRECSQCDGSGKVERDLEPDPDLQRDMRQEDDRFWWCS